MSYPSPDLSAKAIRVEKALLSARLMEELDKIRKLKKQSAQVKDRNAFGFHPQVVDPAKLSFLL